MSALAIAARALFVSRYGDDPHAEHAAECKACLAEVKAVLAVYLSEPPSEAEVEKAAEAVDPVAFSPRWPADGESDFMAVRKAEARTKARAALIASRAHMKGEIER